VAIVGIQDTAAGRSNREESRHGATCPAVVVIAASAGGYEALVELLPSVSGGVDAAIVIALHRGVGHRSFLVELLRNHTTLTVREAGDGEPLRAGAIYICPPGMHITAGQTLRLIDGPRLNFVRPSADLMFTSLAWTHRSRAIGVVLSGTGTDGAIGSKSIVDAGGVVIAQDAASARWPEMPAAAAALGPAQWVLPPREIGPVLLQVLARQDAPGRAHDEAGTASDPRNRARTKVLLVDDHQIVRDGLRAMLNAEHDLSVLANDAADGRDAVRLSARFKPDVVVMDLGMPELDGFGATSQIVAMAPHTKIVALTAHTGARTTDRALRAGASAVLSKQKAYDELTLAIRSVLAGRVYVSRQGHAATETTGSR
jgi:two-component system chemotaxis response regulator CheB